MTLCRSVCGDFTENTFLAEVVYNLIGCLEAYCDVNINLSALPSLWQVTVILLTFVSEYSNSYSININLFNFVRSYSLSCAGLNINLTH